MIFAKSSILDVWQGSEYASTIYTTISIRRLQSEVLAIYLLNLLNLLQYISSANIQ